MKRYALLCVILFHSCFSGLLAQQRRLDSVLALNNAYHREDSLKAIYLRETFRAYASVKNFPKMRQYIDSAVLMASKLPNKGILAFIYWRAGGSNHNIDRLAAVTYYNRSIETAHAYGALRTEAGSYLNLGALYLDLGDFSKSLDAHEHALRIFSELRDEGGRSSCLMNMSSIYVEIKQYVKGMEYLRRALKDFEEADSKRGIAVALEQMIEILFNASDAELVAMGIPPANRQREIAAAVDKGLRASLATDDNSVKSSFYKNYGRYYEQNGNLAAAEQSYLKSVAAVQGDETEISYPDDLLALGRFYINRQRDYGKGLPYLHLGLRTARRQNSSATEEKVLNALSESYERAGRYDSSLYYFRQAIVVKDSMYNREKEQEITRRQLKIDFDIKERDYKSAQQLADARLKQQEQEILLRRQQLQISDKEKTLQRLTFLQKQAELESQKKLQAQALKQEQQKAVYETRSRDQQIKVQTAQLTLNRRVSLFLGILAVIVFAVALFIFNARRRTEKLNRIVSEQKAELEDLVAVKDKIFSIVSHDMRTPVNNIIAFSSLLEDGDIEQERLALYLEQIKGTLDHTSSLMENMLNWASSQMQGFTPVFEQVNLASVAAQIRAGVEPSLYKKRIACVDHLPPELYVRGDQNMVELIVRNLLNNAIKFSHPGVQVEMSATREDNHVVFRVKDAGVGMSPDKVDLINHTQNAIQSTPGTGREKGTGLGLMLCKHFARMMHGNISVQSKEGSGSVVSLRLPAA